jgi:hypothetical protein
MGKAETIADAQARAAAERIEAARAAGQQMALPLADETAKGEVKRGRGAGKATSQMRDWLATKGFRMPEDVLAEMAALTVNEDAFMAAMRRTEQVLAWAQGAGGAATPGQRLDTFKFVFTAQLRAAEALIPYGLGKITPDVAPVQAVQVFVAGGQAAGGAGKGPDLARDVTPQARRIAPPPMPHEMQQNQGVANVDLTVSDADTRTEGASR